MLSVSSRFRYGDTLPTSSYSDRPTIDPLEGVGLLDLWRKGLPFMGLVALDGNQVPLGLVEPRLDAVAPHNAGVRVAVHGGRGTQG